MKKIYAFLIFEILLVLNVVYLFNYTREFYHSTIILKTYSLETRSFFRFTTEIGSNYLGNTSFNRDIYLVGASVVACMSKPQIFEVVIRSGPKTVNAIIIPPVDENGNSWFDWATHVYFYLAVNSTSGHATDAKFLPLDYAILIPQGDLVHFSMFSNELGTGGTFTLYYLFK